MNNTPKHFIEQRIESDLEKNTYNGKVVTRFPPEPSGYLHIGHAKAICLDFGMAQQYSGRSHLRFDDTNPAKEEREYSEAIKQDIEWLGFSWDEIFYASSYFEKLYAHAVELIKQGKAYVCELSPEKMREFRGTLTTPGTDSPFRHRSIEENLSLFERMKAGEFEEGSHVLRAKIDMAAGNINMRDPVIYRILKKQHPHLDETWNIYPMYDYAHCMSDAYENITHSLCTLEFQDHRPLYEWFIEQLLPKPHPQQIEFSRLNLSHTITSKRKLRLLVDEKKVSGWDDPRLPTLVGLRRRGVTPKAIRDLCQTVGITKSDSVIDMSLLEECVRSDLNETAMRAFCVLNPLKVVITNWQTREVFVAPNHPQQPEKGTREMPFTQEIYIDKDDFMETPSKGYFRLSPGSEVRLRYGYVIRCDEVVKNAAGEVTELRCSYDPETLGKNPEGRKVKGVIHWVSASEGRRATVRLYDRLFSSDNPGISETDEAYFACLNTASLTTLADAIVEPGIFPLTPETRFQFERVGYFVADRYDCTEAMPVFNRVVSLRDTWKDA